jgi:cysteine dioxygenase
VKSNCFLTVLSGTLTETLYEGRDIGEGCVAGPGRSRCLAAGSTAYINDDYGVHKVGNFSQVGAVSLHVYAPGWKTAIIYEEVEELHPTDASGAPLDSDWGDF